MSLKKVFYWTTFYWSSWRRLCFPPFFRQQLHLLRPRKWSLVCSTYGLSRKQALYDIIFFKWIHSWCHFSPLLNSSDMIVPRLFRRKFFAQRETPPTNFHGTIRCDVNSFLQPANFLSTLCSCSIDGTTVLSAILNYSPRARKWWHPFNLGCATLGIYFCLHPQSSVTKSEWNDLFFLWAFKKRKLILKYAYLLLSL